jgi:hypothetical protein
MFTDSVIWCPGRESIKDKKQFLENRAVWSAVLPNQSAGEFEMSLILFEGSVVGIMTLSIRIGTGTFDEIKRTRHPSSRENK